MSDLGNKKFWWPLKKEPLERRLTYLDEQLLGLRILHTTLSMKVREIERRNREPSPNLKARLLEVEAKGAVLSQERRRVFALVKYTKVQSSVAQPSVSPKFGERILLLILTKEERANIPGDLEEEFRQIAAKHGERYAKLWYYKQVAASAWPIIWKVARWGVIGSLGAWIKRLI
ncbi:MAG TPA: hypothetical protein VGX48_18795 [Pyrinomonadaceae bacterium]|jgi:hypothetical protein|nr:hypothetical protein [Pyrinomonadaceae bacterium]